MQELTVRTSAGSSTYTDAELAKALKPKRAAIVKLLLDAPNYTTSRAQHLIGEDLGIPQNRVSYHLLKLSSMRIVALEDSPNPFDRKKTVTLDVDALASFLDSKLGR